MLKKWYYINFLMRPPPAATTRSSLDRSLPVTLLMKLGIMAAQAAFTLALLQLWHVGWPLLAQNAVNVVPDTVLKTCTIRARRWLVLFLLKLLSFLLRHLSSRVSCITCGICSLQLGWWGVSLAWCMTCSKAPPLQLCTLSIPTHPGPTMALMLRFAADCPLQCLLLWCVWWALSFTFPWSGASAQA